MNTKLEVLRGTLFDESPLSALRANHLVWSIVFRHFDDWLAHIDKSSVAYVKPYCFDFKDFNFPAPTGININMMPIRLYDACGYSYRQVPIPEEVRLYSSLISRLPIRTPYEDGVMRTTINSERIAYLTIQEGIVQSGQSHRRPGLHVERPGLLQHGGQLIKRDRQDKLYNFLAWGLGTVTDEGIPTDGIYMASNVADTCRVWPVLIDKPEEVSDEHGGLEDMRIYLGEGHNMAANEMYWITDRTPHESLPYQDSEPVYRQFFRLVVGRISVWYAKHNTPNPLGVLPDAPISYEDKFGS